MALTMRQSTPTLPVTTKMLRHFAVVTVAITACIGIFAQGENAEVAAKPTQAATQESGGSFLDFGAAERNALTSGTKGSREVNGMKLASGTRLNTGGDDGGGGGGGGGGADGGSGYTQTPQPAMRQTQVGPTFQGPGLAQGSGPASLAAPPPVPKDPNGVPAPGAAATTGRSASVSKPQQPRKPSQQDIERMMAASSMRSGRATTD